MYYCLLALPRERQKGRVELTYNSCKDNYYGSSKTSQDSQEVDREAQDGSQINGKA